MAQQTQPPRGGKPGAMTQAMQAATGHRIRVIDYHQHAIGAGADAKAAAYLELRVNETQTLFGVGMDADVISAALKAIVSGLERATAQGTQRAQCAVASA